MQVHDGKINKVMRLFDYIYYRTFHLYKYKWKDDDPKMYAIGLVSLLQTIHILTLLFFYLYFIDTKIYINKVYVVAFFLLIIALNFYRYRDKGKSFRLLEDKWKGELAIKDKVFGYLIIFYIILSIFLFIVSAYL